MPKIPTTKQDSDSTSTSGPKASGSPPNVLKRNQVCIDLGLHSTLPNAAPLLLTHTIVSVLLGLSPMSQTQTGMSSLLTMGELCVCSRASLQKWYSDHVVVSHRDALFTFFPLAIPSVTRRDLARHASDLTRMLSRTPPVVWSFQSTRNARSMKVLVAFSIVLLQCSISNLTK